MSKQQTIEEMREALAAFEREGMVLSRFNDEPGDTWYAACKPNWDFEKYSFRPCPPKPAAPRKPREYWINDYGDDLWYRHNTAPMAKSCLRPSGETVHVREVLLPDEPQPVDRTPWMLSTDGFGIFDGDGVIITTASTREGAARIVSTHNRAIGLSSEEGEA